MDVNWAYATPVIVATIGLLGYLLGPSITNRGRRQDALQGQAAEQAKVAVQEKRDAGQLALDVADRNDQAAERADQRSQRAEERAERAELKADKAIARTEWQGFCLRLIADWWPQHERRDIAIEAELEHLDPGALARLPARVAFPTLPPAPD